MSGEQSIAGTEIPVADEDARYAGIVEMVQRNPASRPLYRAALERARTRIDRRELCSMLEDVPKSRTCTQTPQTVVGALVRHGALEETILVDGEPYGGTPEQFRADESITEATKVSYAVATTTAGKRFLEADKPSSRLEALLESKPEHARSLMEVLMFCDCSDGKTRDEIADMLYADGDALMIDPNTGRPSVYPAYFTGELEDAGALTWNGTWKLTREGEEFLAGQK